MNPLIPFAILTITAISAYVIRSERMLRFAVLVSTTIVSSLVSYTAVLALYEPISFGATGLWYIDQSSALVLLTVSVLAVLAAVVSYRYIGIEYQRGILSLADVRLYYLLFPLFILPMLAAVMSNSLIVLWIAMEGTTLATAFLVGIYRRKSSLEAAWKYVLLCSMGIGLALTGLVLTMFAFQAVGLTDTAIFLWTNLAQAATHQSVNIALLKLAFVFVMVGFSTKIGLVPLHAWLPDAFSKTPSPISALLAAGLLPVSLFSLLRIRHVVDTALQNTSWTGTFFLVFGLLSILLPGAVIGVQQNYKRMLSYAVIAHMGIMVFSLGVGPLGIIPAFMQLPAFALLTSAAFFLSGDILLQARSTDIHSVRGLQRRMPITSLLFLLVLLLFLAAPPSALFAADIFMIGYGLQAHPVFSIIALFGIMLVVIAIMRIAFIMFFDDEDTPTAQEKHWSITHVVSLLEILMVFGLGIYYLTPNAIQFFLKIATPLMTQV